jgi:hypothetical protein
MNIDMKETTMADSVMTTTSSISVMRAGRCMRHTQRPAARLARQCGQSRTGRGHVRSSPGSPSASTVAPFGSVTVTLIWRALAAAMPVSAVVCATDDAHVIAGEIGDGVAVLITGHPHR